MAPPRWVSRIDAFRSVPQDLVETSPSGAVMTLVAFATCSLLFFCELGAFLRPHTRQEIALDTNQDSSLAIHFDLTLLDLSCELATVSVRDAFGVVRRNITKAIHKQPIDHSGRAKGRAYTDEELVELDFVDQKLTPEEIAELGSDWSSSSDQFRHASFDAVVEAHDFTMINFYADWCYHCRLFLPTWNEVEEVINNGTAKFFDADNLRPAVRALKINCVEFEEVCTQQKVQSFPQMRLYRRGVGVTPAPYQGPRTLQAINSYLSAEVAHRHMHVGATFHDMFSESCRIFGRVEVSRVPGSLRLRAAADPLRALNLAFINLSHHVHQFSFGERPGLVQQLPAELRPAVAPLNGRVFTASRFHQAPVHFIKVVHTRLEQDGLRCYQQTHQWSVQTVGRRETPEVSFSYDISPVEVVVRTGGRRWYDFLTSVFAIIGGTYTIMSLVSGLLNVSSRYFKAVINKLG